jgi:hypothetical protein
METAAILVIVALLAMSWGKKADKQQDAALETRDAVNFFGNGCISLFWMLVCFIAFFGAIGAMLTSHPEMFLPR